MNKAFINIVFIFISLCATAQSPDTAQSTVQNVYNYSVTTLDGQQHSLNDYAGKKIAIVVIPSTETSSDSLFLDSINALAFRYQDSINIIGIPTYETGYADDSLTSLTGFYDSLVQTPCIITQGMASTKTSPYQQPLFAWLTNEIQNGHFDKDVTGVGQSFFIDASGNLYGVFGPEQSFNDALVQTMLQTPSVTQ